MLRELVIDPDIARAATLPAWSYSDPGFYERCRESVFARSWQWIGDSSMVKVPMQVTPITLLEGCLDEPLLLTRDLKDNVHCLSNVCTHRGTVLCEKGGHERHLTCRYHGRRFDLDGRCTYMPEFKEVAGFPSATDHLPRIEMESWREMLFARAVGGGPGLAEVVREMDARVGFLPIERFEFDAGLSRDYLVRANWALYCDNYLEGFHIPFVHASLNQALDYGSYRTELFAWSNLQVGVSSGGDEVFELPAGHADHGQRISAYYFWVFPNMMFNFYPWGLSINIVSPLGVDRTRVRFLSYVWRPNRLDAGAGTGLDRVEREDEAIVEAVQRGTRSRFYERGRYSPTREQGVHHFHRLLAQAVGGKG
jgi:choline monooxygenase